ncbi:hypothetical protein V501_01616 [Pseudogymnoascus sp. VKM F-4519 (FW-2642)]|nr:hypothetical protein V501_01616 [Pseudogymnoascus sp. VKM F-4519 (FW-2642)]
MDELRGLLLYHGPSPVVASFIAQERDRLDLSSILEETFRRIDLGPRNLVCRQGAYVSSEVEFLLRQGARFDESCDADKLLEETYRYIELGPLEFRRRAGACLSPEVEFLLVQGASFEKVPCKISRLFEATIEYLQRSDQSRDNFLFRQAEHNIIHDGWYDFLKRVYKSLLKSVDNETLYHIIRLLSRQQRDHKIYTMPFMRWTFSIYTFRINNSNLINASIAELRGRLGGLDGVTIRVQGRKIGALRPLLQARSSYFKRLMNNDSKKMSFDIKGSYKTIQFVVLYALHIPSSISLSQFGPRDSRRLTEKNLDELINILYAANTFEMSDLFSEVELYIVVYANRFIYPKNAQEIKDIAKEVNAVTLERYCDAFIATNLRTFTLFLSLPIELRISIWRQIASQLRLVPIHRIRKAYVETPPHIVNLLGVSRDSNSEIQQFWGGPRIGGINFQFDIIWVHTDYLPFVDHLTLKEARYCAIPAPDPHLNPAWELEVSKVISYCPRLKVLYLARETLYESDEFEYCRKFTNREPTTLVETRNWIEESAHQRLLKKLPNVNLPEIMLMDEHEIKRLSATPKLKPEMTTMYML